MRPPSPALVERSTHQNFLKPFARQPGRCPPIWLMRQAGRYLPEYRATRSRAGGFLDLCYRPELAAEVTLQPIRRFGFDAAIIFSDILVVADALGVRVEFVEGEGPRLSPVRSVLDVRRLDRTGVRAKLQPVYDAVALVRGALASETALIGFCGGPWTVATYMVGGRGSADQADARLWAYRDPIGFGELIEVLTEISIEHLAGQIAAGADAIQVFDTWAGSLPDDQFERWVVAPTRRLVRELKQRYPERPIIGFPRGAGEKTRIYARQTGIDGVGCDTSLSLDAMEACARDENVVVQGNLDPLLLVAGGSQLDGRVNAIIAAMSGQPFIFNLGHGILPETPVEHVSRLVDLVRG